VFFVYDFNLADHILPEALYINSQRVPYSLLFYLRDNSVHLHLLSLLVDIFMILKKKTTLITILCRHLILIGKSLKHFYVLYESLI